MEAAEIDARKGASSKTSPETAQTVFANSWEQNSFISLIAASESAERAGLSHK